MNEYLEQARVRESHEDQAERMRVAEEDDRRLASQLAEQDYRGPDWRPPKRELRKEAFEAGTVSLWRRLVLDRDQGCAVHGNPADCQGGLEAHHVVYAQHLRRERPDLLWNPLVGMGVCHLVHSRHHHAIERIEYELIPRQVRVFLIAQGFGAYLERRYDYPFSPASGATLRDGQA